MKDPTIYEKCPVYSSDRFLLRLIEQEDAKDLLECYSDKSAVRLMNSDNCSGDFYITTLDEMAGCIRAWQADYEHGMFIRFSIIDTQTGKVIGTIEMYDRTNKIGILRLDLCSAYEKQDCILELLKLSIETFHTAFGVQHVIMKAIPNAAERISALLTYGFVPAENEANVPRIHWTWIEGEKQPFHNNNMIPYGDYYIHNKRQAARLPKL